MEVVSCLVRLSHGNADECRVWRLSDGVARPKFGVLADCHECESRSLRIEDRLGVVADRDGAGGGLLHIPVSIVRGQGSREHEFPWIRRVMELARSARTRTALGTESTVDIRNSEFRPFSRKSERSEPALSAAR
jgi:hypothetical protein